MTQHEETPALADALHLWEPEHDYYGPEASYWGTPSQQAPYVQRFETWADFAAEGMSQAPQGLNFLYRWDWHAWHIDFPGDYPDGSTGWELELFWLMPRKGIMARSVVKVTPEDEAAVRTWLAPHWWYMQGLWAPLSTNAPLTTTGDTP